MHQVIARVPWVEPGAIEAQVEKLLQGYMERFGRIVGPPVPVRRLIEGYLELSIDWCLIPEAADERIWARLDPGRCAIQMNERHLIDFEQYFGTETFTLAHEAGHWRLHVGESDATQLGLFADPVPAPFLCRTPVNGLADRYEWQANRFAAALAMPEGMIKDAVAEVNIYSWPGLYRLKDDFAVTISALTNRLSDLGLLHVSADKRLWANRAEACGQTTLA